ncbi:MAG: GWxTD domain-containing protein [Candidatus Aminicenantales bacterium]
MKKIHLLAIFLLPAFLGSCRLYNLERKLGPEDADFISKVRYIISGEERKIFLELPPSERPKFEEEFWKKRDPDPNTEENEYKTEYFQRMDQATNLFRSEGRAGWITDRGRIYILFGPPPERMTYPSDMYGYCQEIWYYGAFPVVFIDEHCSGSYVMQAINLEHLQELNIAQRHFQKAPDADKKLFDYDVSVTKTRSDVEKYEGVIAIKVPYKRLWFISGKSAAKALETTLFVQAEVKVPTGETFWREEKEFQISIKEEDLPGLEKDSYLIEIPLVLKGNLDKLRNGKNMLTVNVQNSTEGEELRKAVRFTLD